eukprot:4593292-Pyramimonas_sp.AAC.1
MTDVSRPCRSIPSLVRLALIPRSKTGCCAACPARASAMSLPPRRRRTRYACLSCGKTDAFCAAMIALIGSGLRCASRVGLLCSAGPA